MQFCPHSPHTFAAVSENGHVQQWDLRKPDRYFQHFTAHSGPIFACDWHPETTWLATASRDKTIKVYLSCSMLFQMYDRLNDIYQNFSYFIIRFGIYWVNPVVILLYTQ